MDFFDAVVEYEIALWNHLEARLQESGAVSLAVLSALRIVERHGGSGRVRELQDELRITVGAASKLADRLERDGLVRRSSNPSDRRSSVLELTPLGRERFAAASEVADAALAAHLAETAAPAEQLIAELRRLDAALAPAAADGAAR
jgi:DNA-binding MarR family transcriptional regulator